MPTHTRANVGRNVHAPVGMPSDGEVVVVPGSSRRFHHVEVVAH